MAAPSTSVVVFASLVTIGPLGSWLAVHRFQGSQQTSAPQSQLYADNHTGSQTMFPSSGIDLDRDTTSAIAAETPFEGHTSVSSASLFAADDGTDLQMLGVWDSWAGTVFGVLLILDVLAVAACCGAGRRCYRRSTPALVPDAPEMEGMVQAAGSRPDEMETSGDTAAAPEQPLSAAGDVASEAEAQVETPPAAKGSTPASASTNVEVDPEQIAAPVTLDEPLETQAPAPDADATIAGNPSPEDSPALEDGNEFAAPVVGGMATIAEEESTGAREDASEAFGELEVESETPEPFDVAKVAEACPKETVTDQGMCGSASSLGDEAAASGESNAHTADMPSSTLDPKAAAPAHESSPVALLDALGTGIQNDPRQTPGEAPKQLGVVAELLEAAKKADVDVEAVEAPSSAEGACESSTSAEEEIPVGAGKDAKNANLAFTSEEADLEFVDQIQHCLESAAGLHTQVMEHTPEVQAMGDSASTVAGGLAGVAEEVSIKPEGILNESNEEDEHQSEFPPEFSEADVGCATSGKSLHMQDVCSASGSFADDTPDAECESREQSTTSMTLEPWVPDVGEADPASERADDRHSDESIAESMVAIGEKLGSEQRGDINEVLQDTEEERDLIERLSTVNGDDVEHEEPLPSKDLGSCVGSFGQDMVSTMEDDANETGRTAASTGAPAQAADGTGSASESAEDLCVQERTNQDMVAVTDEANLESGDDASDECQEIQVEPEQAEGFNTSDADEAVFEEPLQVQGTVVVTDEASSESRDDANDECHEIQMEPELAEGFNTSEADEVVCEEPLQVQGTVAVAEEASSESRDDANDECQEIRMEPEQAEGFNTSDTDEAVFEEPLPVHEFCGVCGSLADELAAITDEAASEASMAEIASEPSGELALVALATSMAEMELDAAAEVAINETMSDAACEAERERSMTASSGDESTRKRQDESNAEQVSERGAACAGTGVQAAGDLDSEVRNDASDASENQHVTSEVPVGSAGDSNSETVDDACEVPAIQDDACEVPELEDDACEAPELQDDASEVQKNQDDASELPAIEVDACRAAENQDDASAVSAIQDDACEVPATQDDASEVSAIQDDACEVQEDQDDACEVQEDQDDASEVSAISDDACEVSAIQDDACEVQEDQDDASEVPAIQDDACEAPDLQDDVCEVPELHYDASAVPEMQDDAGDVLAEAADDAGVEIHDHASEASGEEEPLPTKEPCRSAGSFAEDMAVTAEGEAHDTRLMTEAGGLMSGENSPVSKSVEEVRSDEEQCRAGAQGEATGPQVQTVHGVATDASSAAPDDESESSLLPEELQAIAVEVASEAMIECDAVINAESNEDVALGQDSNFVSALLAKETDAITGDVTSEAGMSMMGASPEAAAAPATSADTASAQAMQEADVDSIQTQPGIAAAEPDGKAMKLETIQPQLERALGTAEPPTDDAMNPPSATGQGDEETGEEGEKPDWKTSCNEAEAAKPQYGTAKQTNKTSASPQALEKEASNMVPSTPPCRSTLSSPVPARSKATMRTPPKPPKMPTVPKTPASSTPSASSQASEADANSTLRASALCRPTSPITARPKTAARGSPSKPPASTPTPPTVAAAPTPSQASTKAAPVVPGPFAKRLAKATPSKKEDGTPQTQLAAASSARPSVPKATAKREPRGFGSKLPRFG